MISSRVGHSLDRLILRLYRLLFLGRRIRPNTLTVCGVIVSVAIAPTAASGRLFLSGVLLLLSGFFDLLDGAVARNLNMVTKFGGFLDSVLDRYSDLLVMLGICAYFVRSEDLLFSVVTFFAAVGVAIIPYARARAEAACIECHNGILERPERIVLLILGFLIGDIGLKVAIVLLAVFAHVTVFQRIWFVRKQALDDTKVRG